MSNSKTNALSRQQRKFIQDFEVECPHCGATFEHTGRWLEHSKEIFGNE